MYLPILLRAVELELLTDIVLLRMPFARSCAFMQVYVHGGR